MAPALEASLRPPTEPARAWAVATVVTACRTAALGIAEAEDRLTDVFAARTFAELYGATRDLPYPRAPLMLPAPR